MHLPNVQSTCALIRNLGRLHWRRDLISYWLLQTKMHPRLHVLPFNMYSAKPLVNIARKWAFPKQLPAKGMIGQGRQILAVHGNSCRYSRSFLPLMWKFQVDFPPSWYQNKSFVGDQPRSVVNAAELSIQFTFWKRMEGWYPDVLYRREGKIGHGHAPKKQTIRMKESESIEDRFCPAGGVLPCSHPPHSQG